METTKMQPHLSSRLISVLCLRLRAESDCVVLLRSRRYGHVFLWDSGSSVGEITGHSKTINSIDYRPTRPFRVVTAGEDKLVGWFEGPPFRFKTSLSVCFTLNAHDVNSAIDLEYQCVHVSAGKLASAGPGV